MPSATARPDPGAPYARAELTVSGLAQPPERSAFQLRRSQVDYSEPYLDVGGWSRAEADLLPLDAWWDAAQGRYHFLVGGQLSRHIDPGPLRLRVAGHEIDLFWPEHISVYDDGTLADHAHAAAVPVRIVGEAPPQPAQPPAPEPTPPPAPKPGAAGRQRWWFGLAGVLVLVAAAAAVIADRQGSGAAPPAPIAEPPPSPVTIGDALQAVLGDMTVEEIVRRIDPTLFAQPASAIIAQVNDPEALLRYGAEKLVRREPVAADRLFEEAAKPRFGPAHNQPYAPALIARALLYDPSVRHDATIPVPNPELAAELYRRAASLAGGREATLARVHLARLETWRQEHRS